MGFNSELKGLTVCHYVQNQTTAMQGFSF